MAVLSWDQLAALAVKVGFPPGPAAIAVAITQPESGRNDTTVQQGMPYSQTGWGLWQITPGNSEPQFGIDNQLLDPYWNARAAYQKWSDAGGFRPWTTWVNGLEQPYLPDAEAAVSVVTHLSVDQIDALVGGARSYRNPGETTPTGVATWAPLVDAATRTLTAQAVTAHNTTAAVAALRGRWATPVPHPPAPGTVVLPPERIRRGK